MNPSLISTILAADGVGTGNMQPNTRKQLRGLGYALSLARFGLCVTYDVQQKFERGLNSTCESFRDVVSLRNSPQSFFGLGTSVDTNEIQCSGCPLSFLVYKRFWGIGGKHDVQHDCKSVLMQPGTMMLLKT